MPVFGDANGKWGRNAYLWAAVGVIGLAFGAIGYMLLRRDDDDESQRSVQASAAGSVTAATTVGANASTVPTNPPPSPSPQPSEVATASPGLTQTVAPQGQQNPSTANAPATATATPRPPTPLPPTPEPTAAPMTSRVFCDTTSSSSPPNSVFGLLTIGGQPGPAGTIVTITFDGAAGRSVVTSAAGGYRVDFPSGGEDCANRAGAAIAIVVGGQAFTVGTLGGSPATRMDITVS